VHFFELADNGVEWRMVIDDDDFRCPGADGNGVAKLSDKPSGVSPLAKVHDGDADDWCGWGSRAANLR
jgi:hypothetical protein